MGRYPTMVSCGSHVSNTCCVQTWLLLSVSLGAQRTFISLSQSVCLSVCLSRSLIPFPHFWILFFPSHAAFQVSAIFRTFFLPNFVTDLYLQLPFTASRAHDLQSRALVLSLQHAFHCKGRAALLPESHVWLQRPKSLTNGVCRKGKTSTKWAAKTHCRRGVLQTASLLIETPFHQLDHPACLGQHFS